MERIKNQFHSVEIIPYIISRVLERASYYGLRSLIILYMINGILKMNHIEAITIYGWFTASLIFSKVIGALLGDLIIGNKNAIIIGGIIQALGAFSFCIPSSTGLYVGLFLVVLGGGLYSPNIISNFGKLYLNKTKLLDAAFTIFYLVVNIGAFFGVVYIGFVGGKFGWNAGFILVGIIMLLSVIPILFSKDITIEVTKENKETIGNRILNIAIVFVVVSLFWAIYELGNIRIFDLQSKLGELSTGQIPKSIWNSLNSVFIMPISIVAIVLWTTFYYNQFIKLAIGFLFGAISFGILFLIPEIPTEQHIVFYLLSLLFLSISEIHIAPIIYSVLTQYANPKYLAILISLAFASIRLLSMILGLFIDKFQDNSISFTKIAMVAMSVICIGLVVFVVGKNFYLKQKEL